MNFNLLSVVMFGAGALLVYSGIKNVDPKEVITAAMEGKTAESKPFSSGGSFDAPPTNEDDNDGTFSSGGSFAGYYPSV